VTETAKRMELSDRGAEFIGRFEGLRLEPYNDPAGHATIGYGHLIHLGHVTAADRSHYANFTHKDALELLRADAEKAAAAVRAIRPPVTRQERFDALVSFAYNLGGGILEPTHTIGRELRKPDRGDTANAFLLYDTAGGQVLAGLKRRREAERKLWLTGKYA
jgi:lysozyme